MTSPVPHALTTSRMSVTKAGGLCDAPGAERSPNRKDGDTVTHVWGQLLLYCGTMFHTLKSGKGIFEEPVAKNPQIFYGLYVR